MIVAFFKDNIEYVRQFVSSIQGVAFWFSEGLTSYHHLDTAIKIDSIKIEESIYEKFKFEYPELIEKYSVEVFGGDPRLVSKGTLAKKFCFFASNDTIMRSFKSVINYLDPSEYEVFCRGNENALEAARKLNINATEIKFTIPNPEKYSLLILGNDWGPLEQKINLDFISKKVNTVCIQESSIDFNPIDGRMRNCSFPVFQGIATLENLDLRSRITAVIGNPRFEQLTPSPMPTQRKALINVNFTYGVFEEYRNIWVNDIVSVCRDMNYDYVLSQHPRDKGNFEGFNVLKSNPLLVHDSIRDCSVLISRFSALLTEAICLGRPCIYYNPHGENMHYKFRPDNKMFFYATNKDELEVSLREIIDFQEQPNLSESDFLKQHLGNTIEGRASQYIAVLLKDLVTFKAIKKTSVFERFKILVKILKLYLRNRPF